MRRNSKVIGTKVTEKMYKLIQEHAISLYINESQIIRSIIWEINNNYNVRLLNISSDGPYFKKDLRNTLGSRVSFEMYTHFSEIALAHNISNSALLRSGIIQYLNYHNAKYGRLSQRRQGVLDVKAIPTELRKTDPLYHFFPARCNEKPNNQQLSSLIMQFQKYAVNNLRMSYKVTQITAAVVLLLSSKPNH